MQSDRSNMLNVTRRHFLRNCQVGLGGLALATLEGSGRQTASAQVAQVAQAPGEVNPLAPRPAALCPQGQERHLSAHGRVAAASGPVRLQAGAGAAHEPELPRVVPARPAFCLHQRRAEAARHAAALRPAWHERGLGFRGIAAAGGDRRRADVHQVDAFRPVQSCPGRAAALHRLGPVRQAVDGFLGDLRPGFGEPGSARLHRAGLQRHLPQRRQQRLEQRLSCRPSTRACSADRRATRCCTSPTRAAWTAACAGSASTPCAI